MLSRKIWSKCTVFNRGVNDSHLQSGSLPLPSAENPVGPATESQSPTTRDTIRLIVRGSLGSCSSSSECEFSRLVSQTQIHFCYFTHRSCINDSAFMQQLDCNAVSWTALKWCLAKCPRCCSLRSGRQHDRERGWDCCERVERMSGEYA